MNSSADPAAEYRGNSEWPELLREALSLEIPPADALPVRREQPDTASVRAASVLIAVVDQACPYLWFTQRSSALRHHPGQISFPGGRVEASDRSAWAAALREAHEEIGLEPNQVTRLGRLPGYATVTGFAISPFVGWVSGQASVRPDYREVARLFPVPLAYAMEAGNYSARTIHRNGQDYTIYAIDFEHDHIWGATAGMLLGLAQRVAMARGVPFRPPEPEPEGKDV